MRRRTAVVIGSGPNGLAAAITLARAGHAVTVLEAAARPGGALATEELTLPGFRHDTFSAVHPAAAASPVLARFPLAQYGLRWIHPEVCCAHPLPDGPGAALHHDLDRTVSSLEALSPGDGERWRAFAAPLLDSFGALRAAMLAGFPPLAGAARFTRAAGVRRALGLARVTLMSAEGLARELFRAPGARAWLYGSALHADTPLDRAGSAIGAVYLTLLGHGAGWPSPEGGAGRLATALVSYLESLGGVVRLDAPVTAVLSRGRRVTGVRLANGEGVEAGIVVADVMPRALVRLTGSGLPGRYARSLASYRYGPATLKVDWALDGPIPWTDAAARAAGTVHVGGGEDELVAAARAVTGVGRPSPGPAAPLPERPFLLLGQQTVADPSRAPAGKHTAWAYTRGQAGLDRAGSPEAHVERMEAQVERFAPGFRDLILARHVMGPADLQARDENLIDGDVGGGSYAAGQLLFRPRPALIPYRTPVRGLYLGSAATFPGGGVHGVCGQAAARVAIAEARLRPLEEIFHLD
jgi:phytoene dehydrogenase-like protein